jgi:hypothetical protein
MHVIGFRDRPTPAVAPAEVAGDLPGRRRRLTIALAPNDSLTARLCRAPDVAEAVVGGEAAGQKALVRFEGIAGA